MSTFKIEIIKTAFIFFLIFYSLVPKIEIFCKYFLGKNPKVHIVLTEKNKKKLKKTLKKTLKK